MLNSLKIHSQRRFISRLNGGSKVNLNEKSSYVVVFQSIPFCHSKIYTVGKARYCITLEAYGI